MLLLILLGIGPDSEKDFQKVFNSIFLVRVQGHAELV